MPGCIGWTIPWLPPAGILSVLRIRGPIAMNRGSGPMIDYNRAPVPRSTFSTAARGRVTAEP
jgi:hypothetical protein